MDQIQLNVFSCLSETATFIHLHIVYGCFCATVAKVNSWNRDCLQILVCKTQNVYYVALYPKICQYQIYSNELLIFTTKEQFEICNNNH